MNKGAKWNDAAAADTRVVVQEVVYRASLFLHIFYNFKNTLNNFTFLTFSHFTFQKLGWTFFSTDILAKISLFYLF